MRSTEPLRLLGIGALALLIQLAFYLKFPAWRGGVDIYLIFLLLLAAARGPYIASVFAMAGGVVMDAYSGVFSTFHLFFYFAPVFIGSLIRTQLIVEYNLLGTIAIGLLLLAKIWLQIGVAFSLGMIGSLSHVFQMNYWPVVCLCLLAFFRWRWLIRLVPSPVGVNRIAR